MPDRDLTRRTGGEEAWLRRKTAGRTQAEEAARLGVSRPTLWAVERGLAPLRASMRGYSQPTRTGLLWLARRRSGMGLREAALMAGVSHRTFLIWEKAGDTRLVRFWKAWGFRFW